MTPLVSDEIRPLLDAFNLEDFRGGRHILRDERGWRIRDIQVESMWLARIEPSFDQLSYLMVVHADKQPKALFCFGGTDGLPKISAEPVDCPALDDRIVATLKHLDLLSSNDELSLDGIAYSIHVCTSSLSAGLTFANPKTESLRSVERALFEVAESVAGVMERSELSDYLKTWRRYLN